MPNSQRVLITGANGYIGRLLFESLRSQGDFVWGIDWRCDGSNDCMTKLDIRDPRLVDTLRQRDITHVVHLASIVQPGQAPDIEFDIDVNGTRNVLDACIAAGVKHLTVTSSGAAYGYHADNPTWLSESDPLRGNDEFSYSRHKRLVEEMLAEYREHSPQLKQLVLRPGTVIGKMTSNMITRLFSGRFVLGLRGVASPFVFIWDRDLVSILVNGVLQSRTGIYNVAGDGCLTVHEIAKILRKRVVNVPIWLLNAVLAVTHPLRITRYGPDQIRFMQYRPLLSNERLKSGFGISPTKSSREAFESFAEQLLGSP